MTDAAGDGMAPVPLTDVTGAAAFRGPRRTPRRAVALPYGLRKGRETGCGAHGDKAGGRDCRPASWPMMPTRSR